MSIVQVYTPGTRPVVPFPNVSSVSSRTIVPGGVLSASPFSLFAAIAPEVSAQTICETVFPAPASEVNFTWILDNGVLTNLTFSLPGVLAVAARVAQSLFVGVMPVFGEDGSAR